MLDRQSPRDQARPPLPGQWMMVDARMGDGIAAAVAALPPRSGVIVRPYALPERRRAALIRAIRRAARARRHLLIVADRDTAGFDGRHLPAHARVPRRPAGLLTMAVHDAREAARAGRLRADAVLISPVFATRSHPNAPAIGRRGLARLAAQGTAAAIALGAALRDDDDVAVFGGFRLIGSAL
jgi:thiamine-phosphate pyrophosphorylase